jgi:hypothetical protein
MTGCGRAATRRTSLPGEEWPQGGQEFGQRVQGHEVGGGGELHQNGTGDPGGIAAGDVPEVSAARFVPAPP